MDFKAVADFINLGFSHRPILKRVRKLVNLAKNGIICPTRLVLMSLAEFAARIQIKKLLGRPFAKSSLRKAQCRWPTHAIYSFS